MNVLRFVFKLWTLCTGLLVPVFDTTSVIANRGIGVKRLESEARRCLFHNVTFIVEPKFRLQLYRVILAWLRLNTDFVSAREEIDRLLKKRTFIARRIPSRGIAKLLMACGHFSMSHQVFASRSSSWNSDLQPLIAKLSILNQLGLKRGVRLVAEMTRLRRGESFDLGPVSLAHLGVSGGSGEKLSLQVPGKPILLVGPGPVSEWPDSAMFSEIIFLVTSNTSPKQIAARFEKFEASIFLNGEMGSLFSSNNLSPDWGGVLSQAKTIYARREQCPTLGAQLNIRVEPYPVRIAEFWLGAGGPNLLPQAIGFALSKEQEAWVVGANLYVADVLYQLHDTSLRLERENEFVTCLAQSNHNSVLNFAILRALAKANLITGGTRFLEILSLDLPSYLNQIDLTLGAARK